MNRYHLACLVIPLMALVGFPAAADEEPREVSEEESRDAAKEEARDVRASSSETDCACPKEGSWNVQNLEGWMNCTGPFDIKRKIGEVKDKGTVWVVEEDCSSLFGEASRKKDEDIYLERGESCGYDGTINGEEDGVTMSIDVTGSLEGNEFIKGEMHSEPSLQGMMCEYYRPFEISYDEPIPEDEYEKRREKMQKKLEKIRGKD